MGQKCYEAFYYRRGPPPVLYGNYWRLSFGWLGPRFFYKHTLSLSHSLSSSLRFRRRLERRAQTFMTDKRKGNEARSKVRRRKQGTEKKTFLYIFLLFSQQRCFWWMQKQAQFLPFQGLVVIISLWTYRMCTLTLIIVGLGNFSTTWTSFEKARKYAISFSAGIFFGQEKGSFEVQSYICMHKMMEIVPAFVGMYVCIPFGIFARALKAIKP